MKLVTDQDWMTAALLTLTCRKIESNNDTKDLKSAEKNVAEEDAKNPEALPTGDSTKAPEITAASQGRPIADGEDKKVEEGEADAHMEAPKE